MTRDQEAVWKRLAASLFDDAVTLAKPATTEEDYETALDAIINAATQLKRLPTPKTCLKTEFRIEHQLNMLQRTSELIFVRE